MKRYSLKQSKFIRLANSLPNQDAEQDTDIADFGDRFISNTPKTSLGHRPKIVVLRQDLFSEQREATQSRQYQKVISQENSRKQLTISKRRKMEIKSKKSRIEQPKDWLRYFGVRPTNQITWKRSSNTQRVQPEQIVRPYLIEQVQLHEHSLSKKKSGIRVRVMNRVNQSRSSLPENKPNEIKTKIGFSLLQNPERQKEKLEPWISQESIQHEQHLFRKALRKGK